MKNVKRVWMTDCKNVTTTYYRRFLSSYWLLALLFLLPMYSSDAFAQSHIEYLDPIILFQFYNVQDCGYCNDVAGPWRTNLQDAWSDAQTTVDQTSDNYDWTAQNLIANPAFPYSTNGIPDSYSFGVQFCPAAGGSCSYSPNIGFLQTAAACPLGSRQINNTPQGSNNNIIQCALTVSDVQPPPRFCLSCFGNPIYASTGLKKQTETDYQGIGSLEFTRVYRSDNGAFSSATTQAFINNSSSSSTFLGYFIGTWTYSNTGGVAMFPIVSTYPYISPQYFLQTDDGRSLPFVGPNNSISASADINEKVTMFTVGSNLEWQVRRENDTIEIYNNSGALLQKTLRGGKTFTFTYSTATTPSSIAPVPGLMLSESDAFGHTLSWKYNAAGQVAQMTDPAGGVYGYSYDIAGNQIGVLYPDGTSKTYWYNEPANTGASNMPNALTGISDENGVRYATFQYASSYSTPAIFAVTTQHAGGVNRYSFNYDAAAYYGNVISSTVVTDPLGTGRTYAFQNNLSYNDDSAQTQAAASGSGTVSKSEAYDATGNPATETDFNGNITSHIYDPTRNLETSRTEASGTAQARMITTQWNATWRQPALITEPNRTTAFTYDTLGNVLTKTVTDTTVSPNVSRVWTYTYDGYGRMLTADGPRTDVVDKTTYAYYTCTTGFQCGEVHTITNALGQVTTFNSYNAHGQPLTITDPNGIVTTLTYDKRLRVLSRQVATETTSYSYYPTGLLKQVTLPDTSYLFYTYDAAHRLIKLADGTGNYISYTLDNMGNRTAENSYDAGGVLHRTHTRVINALNQDYQEVNAAGTATVTTSFAYDDDGNQLSAATPLSRNSSSRYDPLSRLTQITDPNSGVTKLSYDANDNLATVIDPRTFLTSYTHNGFDDLTKLVSPDTGTSTSTYDSGGNLKTTTDARGALATFSYDAMNRVTQAAYSDQTINYTYDAGAYGKGRLTGASDANHSMSWAYDTHGRVTGKSQTVAGVTKTVGYTYTNGDLTILVTPSGQTITYGYTNHQVTSIKVGSTTLLSGVTYDPFGPPTAWTWGNSSTVSRAYDEDGNPHQIVTAAVTNGYTVDAASRITSITDSELSSATWNFTSYDALDRIKAASSSAKSRGYTYDVNGNRLTTTGTTASTESIATSSNHLSSTSGGLVRTYGYDAAGNTTSYTGESFTFNQRGRMSTATSSSSTSYIYNALGQLIEKSGNGGTTLLMYDDHGHLLGEYSNTGALIQETIWMDDLPVATLRPNGSTVTIYYVHTDHLGTPRKITNPSGNTVVWRWDPDTFGSVSPSITTLSYNLRFPGQYYLPESGLHYNYFRTYDPQMGKYLESDPTGLGSGINTYAYASGNPIRRKDPTGLDDSICMFNPPMCGEPMNQQDSPLSQAVVDSVTGFGDAFLIPMLVRDALDLNGGVDQCSSAYKDGLIAGTIWGLIPIGLEEAAFLADRTFFNSNRYFRIGLGRIGGSMVPRISSPYLRPILPIADNGHIPLSPTFPAIPPVGGPAIPACGCGK